MSRVGHCNRFWLLSQKNNGTWFDPRTRFYSIFPYSSFPSIRNWNVPSTRNIFSRRKTYVTNNRAFRVTRRNTRELLFEGAKRTRARLTKRVLLGSNYRLLEYFEYSDDSSTEQQPVKQLYRMKIWSASVKWESLFGDVTSGKVNRAFQRDWSWFSI